MWDIRSWSPSSSGSTWVGATVIPVSVMPPGSRIRRPVTRRHPERGCRICPPARPLRFVHARTHPGPRFGLAGPAPAAARRRIRPKVVVSGVDERQHRGPGHRPLVPPWPSGRRRRWPTGPGTRWWWGVTRCSSSRARHSASPRRLAEARRWLQAMRGRTGTLFTGHCVIDEPTGGQVTGVAGTAVRFGVTTDAELDAYLAPGRPWPWPGHSPSTVGRPRSSTASTATRGTSSGSPSPSCAPCWPGSTIGDRRPLERRTRP